LNQQLTLDHAIARAEADAGMRSALEHAESEFPDWRNVAMAYLRRYAEAHARFYGWEVVKTAALDKSFPAPANSKAWGSQIQKAARLGLIERVGAGPDPHRHGNLIPLWQSKVYRAA